MFTITGLWVGIVTFLVTVVEAGVSYHEGTFLRSQWRHMKMNFLNNWGIFIGGTVVFPVMNAVVVPRLTIDKYTLFISVFAGAFLTMTLHRSWWMRSENLGHVFADWTKSGGKGDYWTRDVTRSGWVNIIFMSCQTAVVLLYLISPMPREIVLAVALLFVIFLAAVHLQAKFVQGSVNKWFLVAGLMGVAFFTCIKL